MSSWIRTLAILAVLPFVGVVLTGCGDDEVAASCANGTLLTIVDNHATSGGDHALVVSAEEIATGVEKVYDIRGDNNGHTHSVTVSAADFASLASGDTITVVSSNNGSAGASHTHELQITCR